MQTVAQRSKAQPSARWASIDNMVPADVAQRHSGDAYEVVQMMPAEGVA